MSGPSDEETARMRAFAEASGLMGIDRALAGAVADYRLLKRIEAIERALGINYAEDTLSPALGSDSPIEEHDYWHNRCSICSHMFEQCTCVKDGRR